MEQTWRWFGPDDKISLAEIKQAGATGIVTALHHVPNGTAWDKDDVARRKAEVEASGMRWSVVESIPISEEIKNAAKAYRESWDRSSDPFVGLVKGAAEGAANVGEKIFSRFGRGDQQEHRES